MRQQVFLVLVAGSIVSAARADEPKVVPQAAKGREGFTTLFNGSDFSGWHGQKTMDPRVFNALSADEKAKVLAEGAEDMTKHWKVQDGVIVNDGQGVYLTTDKDFGDIELYVDFKIGPQGDSGVYLRGLRRCKSGISPSRVRPDGADKGSGGLWNNSPGRPARTPWFWPTSRSASGTRSISSRSARAPQST